MSEPVAYTVEILRTADGVRRTCAQTTEPQYRDSTEFLWSEGNYACDCNRHLMFERAAGVEIDTDESGACGDTRYHIEKIVWQDGTEETVDGPWSPTP